MKKNNKFKIYRPILNYKNRGKPQAHKIRKVAEAQEPVVRIELKKQMWIATNRVEYVDIKVWTYILYINIRSIIKNGL